MKDSQYPIAVGVSDSSNSFEAGQEAARMALQQLNTDEIVAWTLAFCGGRHDSTLFMQGLRAQLGDVKIVGGAATGIISNTSLGYSGYECAVAAFPASVSEPTIIAVDGLNRGELEVGRQLGEKLRSTANEEDTVLLFYDSVRSGPPPVLYVGSRLMDGIYQGLAGKPLQLVGAGTMGDFQMTESYIFDGDQELKHGVVAVILPAALQSHTTIMHGCIPVSSFLEITKIDGAVVYELDGRPALGVLMEMLGQEATASARNNLSLTVTLGQKYGDIFAPYDESSYVNRLIISSNSEDGSVTLFEADFEEGTMIQIMARDNQVVAESVRRQAEALLNSLGSREPIFALYIDCAGRSSGFSGAEIEEGSILQAALGPEIPLLGFYSGVEIAPLLGRSRPLDWTGVLTLFSIKTKDDG